jgi:hypothetical protein
LLAQGENTNLHMPPNDAMKLCRNKGEEKRLDPFDGDVIASPPATREQNITL